MQMVSISAFSVAKMDGTVMTVGATRAEQVRVCQSPDSPDSTMSAEYLPTLLNKEEDLILFSYPVHPVQRTFIQELQLLALSI